MPRLTTKDTRTFEYRYYRCDYRSSTLAPCQQPLFEVEKIKVKEIELKELNVTEDIRLKFRKIIETGDELAHLSDPR